MAGAGVPETSKIAGVEAHNVAVVHAGPTGFPQHVEGKLSAAIVCPVRWPGRVSVTSALGLPVVPKSLLARTWPSTCWSLREIWHVPVHKSPVAEKAIKPEWVDCWSQRSDRSRSATLGASLWLPAFAMLAASKP